MAQIDQEQEMAIAALLSCGSLKEAGAQLGVNERTLRRWLADPDFSEAYHEAQRGLLEQVLGRLTAACIAAVDALEANLSKPTPASTQVRAASAILSHALRAREMLELEERLIRLERQLEKSA